MIYKLSREHRVNVGNYEHIIVSGSVELDLPNNIGEKEANEVTAERLNSLMATELADAEAAVPEDQETHLSFYRK